MDAQIQNLFFHCSIRRKFLEYLYKRIFEYFERSRERYFLNTLISPSAPFLPPPPPQFKSLEIKGRCFPFPGSIQSCKVVTNRAFIPNFPPGLIHVNREQISFRAVLMMIDDDGETVSRGILTRYTRHPNRPPLPRGYINARISFDEIPKVTRVQIRPSRRKINLEK